MREPLTARVKHLTGGQDLRLSGADRAFLRDLARVGLITDTDANTFHYPDRKSGARRRLRRLCELGLLRERVVRSPGGERLAAYQFSSAAVGRAWGGYLPNIGSRRNAYHEVLIGRLFFSLGRPSDYRIARRFTARDQSVFGAALSTRPDAAYTDAATGEVVAVEADSGHYTRAQIAFKQSAWRGLRQVWGQPRNASHRLPPTGSVAVFHY